MFYVVEKINNRIEVTNKQNEPESISSSFCL